MARPKAGDAGRYHHGSLREALAQAGLDMLERDGLEALSLRSLAAAVGVSHAAPAHHFGTAKGLRSALAAIGYQRFAEGMRLARAAAALSGPEAQMRAAASAYLAFAQGHPALFRLMFTQALLDWSDLALQEHAGTARRQLSEICEPAAARLGVVDPQARTALEHLVWSSVHGRAHLAIDGQLSPALPAGPDQPREAPDLPALLFGYPPAG